jgi:hypothetical protein
MEKWLEAVAPTAVKKLKSDFRKFTKDLVNHRDALSRQRIPPTTRG